MATSTASSPPRLAERGRSDIGSGCFQVGWRPANHFQAYRYWISARETGTASAVARIIFVGWAVLVAMGGAIGKGRAQHHGRTCWEGWCQIAAGDVGSRRRAPPRWGPITVP